MNYEDIISKVAEHNGLSKEFVDKVYKSYWLTIKERIKELPLKGELNEEEFNRLRTNFNVPSLGKLYVTYESWQSTKRRFNYIEKLRKRNDNTEEDKAPLE